MKKWIWYTLIFASIAPYFYVGYSVSSYWEAAVKYGAKVTHDSLGKQIPLLNIRDTRQGDFYVTIDSLKNRSFFRVIGLTTDSVLCISYGKDASVLPDVLDYSSYIVSPGLFIDKRVSWVDELMNNKDLYREKLDFINADDIDSLLQTYLVLGFELRDAEDEPTDNFLIKFNLADPSVLGMVILFLFIVILIFEKIMSVFISNSKRAIRTIVVLISILVYTFLNLKYFSFPQMYNDVWYGYLFIFISYSLVYFIFQFVRDKIRTKDFEVREFLKFITIILSGVFFTVIFRLISFFLLNISEKYDYELFTTLQQGFKFWTAFATANFLHNLVQYIYSLRRKSKQLQSITSDAKLSTDTLQQSEANINTHFLNNALHAIAALAPVAPDKTETLALSLAKYYRYTTNRQDEPWSSINEEVDALTAYLEVEKIRMGEKLSFIFEISDDVQNVQIPKFILQPLVENAVKYGYNINQEMTKIIVKASRADDHTIKISVCDSGKPFDDDMAEGKGIRNVRAILKRFYLDSHTMTFANEPQKCVEIIMKSKNF